MLKKILSIKINYLSLQICILGIKIHIKRKFKPNKRIYKIPVRNNKIFLETFSNSYCCNPKYITEEIINRNLHCELVWGVQKKYNKNSFPQNIKLVEYGTNEYIEEFASSKIIIRNDRGENDLALGLIKKDNQVYIQTWHGSLGIKKTGVDINTANGKSILSHKLDAKTIDYLISNSEFTNNLFKSIFFNNGKILQIGHPRNDIFFKDYELIKERIFKQYNLPKDTHLLMYAPTFRDKCADLSIYSIDYQKLLRTLENKFGGNWVIFTRLHPKLIELKDSFSLNQANIIDVTDYPDMQELLVIADSVITDYSSCIYDFVLTRRCGFIYASDIEQYNTSRGLYYPLETTPFPIAKKNDELIKNIENFDYEKYKTDVEHFLTEKECVDDGHASEKVVDLIQSIIEGSN